MKPFPLVALLCALMSACQDAEEPCGEGCRVPHRGLGRVFDEGTLTHAVSPRTGWGGLKVRLAGDTVFVLETKRDESSGVQRRLVARTRDSEVRWTRVEEAGEHFSDFTVHPSGEVTLGVERTAAERGGYDLLRLSPGGEVLSRQPVPEPRTLSAEDVGTGLPAQPFRMKGRPVHALTDGWLRTEARGEDVVVAFLTLVDEPPPSPNRPPSDLVSGVMALRWSESRYEEEWARLVDGRHQVDPAAWAYDEFRWREAPGRPLLAIGGDGAVVVGRTWTQSRCLAASDIFGVPTRLDCILDEDIATHMDTEHQAFAFTSFTATGEREGTHMFHPSDAAEFVVFDLAARGGDVAIAGSFVREDAQGAIDYYESSPGAGDRMTPYDGYVAVFERRTGSLRFSHVLGGPRADHISALRWTDSGLLAVGASGWDRWANGMSISRGSGPLLAMFSAGGDLSRMRTVPLDGSQRHFHLLGVDARDDEIVAVGLADAPMTHSGDRGQRANMTFGGLTVELR
ncbi:hypothetical protein HPC49_11835 [Pyxidicoccus fallax]|uniref:Lipoprotein n=1 Tax=Pyxidicoccus fallax TaxID=394095 RepID=A0A848LED4_9BACT|nr:hypothetical protein [Pyxidicoccus fallax]NMO14591.1 hypothetical protein [Pyxidicoccus fallax]NPC78930.1 hypothetical protein [Pyxidicoccus fallax]